MPSSVVDVELVRRTHTHKKSRMKLFQVIKINLQTFFVIFTKNECKKRKLNCQKETIVGSEKMANWRLMLIFFALPSTFL